MQMSGYAFAYQKEWYHGVVFVSFMLLKRNSVKGIFLFFRKD